MSTTVGARLDPNNYSGINGSVLLYAHSSTRNLAQQIAERCCNCTGHSFNSQDGESSSPKKLIPVNCDDTLQPELEVEVCSD